MATSKLRVPFVAGHTQSPSAKLHPLAVDGFQVENIPNAYVKTFQVGFTDQPEGPPTRSRL